MSLIAVFKSWKSNPYIRESIKVWKTIPPREADLIPFPDELQEAITVALRQIGISSLYSHQKLAWEEISHKKNVAIVTGTSSGKSLCYNLPVINNLINDDISNALYLFPTKALSQDQLSALSGLLNEVNHFRKKSKPDTSSIIAATYDGDTPQNVRSEIRKKARIIISNPDMLHAGILPHHTQWDFFFSGLRFVVIDEIHSFRGVFGSHVANVIRRLKRIAKHYGSDIQFILTSATIGNPNEHAQNLIEAPVTLINHDGSERGENHFLIYNPPIIDPDLGLRASILSESILLAKLLYAHNIQSILFCRTRRTVEILLNLTRQEMLNEGENIDLIPTRIRAYRSGYFPAHRRQIEIGLRSCKVRTVIATSALELGIDIGQMGAAFLVGFPGSISGTWQRVGRAGRGNKSSVGVLLTSPNPLDQFLAKHPAYFFEQTPEQARINPNNLLILLHHLQCALFELPFKDGESFGNLSSDDIGEIFGYLLNEGKIHRSKDNYYWLSDTYPSASISLRNASTTRYRLIVITENDSQEIGEIDGDSAPWMVHPEAIYLHEGDTYLVKELDFTNLNVQLQAVNVDYYTKPQQNTEISLITELAGKNVYGGEAIFGEINVTEQVTGFSKNKWGTNERIDFKEITMPPTELSTEGYFVKIDNQTVDNLRIKGLWTNDPNSYGLNWEKQRLLARKRDNFTCQVCGIQETESQHHVHHKTPFRSFPSFKEANVLGNLVTLCQNCHKKVEANVRIRSGLSGLTHLLGYLAPFYLMCDPVDIGVFADPQSNLNKKGPVIGLYDRIPGGMGFSKRLYEIHSELFTQAHEVTISCECKDGCPSCVGPGGEIGSGSKKQTLALLDILAFGKLEGD